MKSYNPSLRKGIIPFSTGKISLTLPYDKAIHYIQLTNDSNFKPNVDKKYLALNRQIESERNPHKTIFYHVKRGELLAGIADRFDVSVKELKKWNHLKNNKITAGTKLKIKGNRA